MNENKKTVLHAGAHLLTQRIAGSITKDSDDNGKMAGIIIAFLVGLVLNWFITSL